MEKEKIIQEIRKNFSSSPFSGEIVNGASGEALEIKQVFKGRNWTEINRAILTEYNSAMSFFSKEAFIYFLPAYMLFLLEAPDNAGVLVDYTINKLTLPIEVDTVILLNVLQENGELTTELSDFLDAELKLSNERVHNFINLMQKFSLNQGFVIKCFLEYMNIHHTKFFPDSELNIAIHRYWFQFRGNDSK